jgi:hypothetical protein
LLPPDNEEDAETEEPLEQPQYHLTDEEVEETDWTYCIRHPADWVISGPLALGGGPGRRFQSWEHAEIWARTFYGPRFLGRIPDAAKFSCNRWAFLVRGNR